MLGNGHPDMHITVNGALCIPTGRAFDRNGDPVKKVEADNYVEVQMIPIHPQRIERVKRNRLRPFLSKG